MGGSRGSDEEDLKRESAYDVPWASTREVGAGSGWCQENASHRGVT